MRDTASVLLERKHKKKLVSVGDYPGDDGNSQQNVYKGLTWDGPNWSCSYDALLTIIMNTMDHHDDAWNWMAAHNDNARYLLNSKTEIKHGRLNMVDVREQLRDKLSVGLIHEVFPVPEDDLWL